MLILLYFPYFIEWGNVIKKNIENYLEDNLSRYFSFVFTVINEIIYFYKCEEINELFNTISSNY